MHDLSEQIRRELLRLTRERGPAKSICPSEVARRLSPADWRPLMPLVREVAAQLVDSGLLQATQRMSIVDPRTAHSPIRLRATVADDEAS